MGIKQGKLTKKLKAKIKKGEKQTQIDIDSSYEVNAVTRNVRHTHAHTHSMKQTRADAYGIS